MSTTPDEVRALKAIKAQIHPPDGSGLGLSDLLVQVERIVDAALASSPSEETPLCGRPPNADNARYLSTCELPAGHAGPHRSGDQGWIEVNGKPTLAVPYEWVAAPPASPGLRERALVRELAEIPDLLAGMAKSAITTGGRLALENASALVASRIRNLAPETCDLCHGVGRVKMAIGSDYSEPCPRCRPRPIEEVAWELRKYVHAAPAPSPDDGALLDELERLEADVLPGRWEYVEPAWIRTGQGAMQVIDHVAAEMRLIAAGRNALPRLLALARAKRS